MLKIKLNLIHVKIIILKNLYNNFMIKKKKPRIYFWWVLTAIVVFSFYFYKVKIIFTPVNFIFCTYLLIIIISINWLELDYYIYYSYDDIIIYVYIKYICICCAHIAWPFYPEPRGVYSFERSTVSNNFKVYSKLSNILLFFYSVHLNIILICQLNKI